MSRVNKALRTIQIKDNDARKCQINFRASSVKSINLFFKYKSAQICVLVEWKWKTQNLEMGYLLIKKSNYILII